MSTVTSPAQKAPGRKASRILHHGSAGMLVAGLLITIGSVLPWVSTPVGSLSGTVGPGLWTLCAGFLAIAGALLPYPRIAFAHAWIPGFAVTAIVIWQLGRLAYLSAMTGSWGQLLPGIGLVLVAGGAAVLLRTAHRMRTAT